MSLVYLHLRGPIVTVFTEYPQALSFLFRKRVSVSFLFLRVNFASYDCAYPPTRWQSQRITPIITKTERTTGTVFTVQRRSAPNHGKESTKSYFETCDFREKTTSLAKNCCN